MKCRIKSKQSQSLIDYAYRMATKWHEGQKRKYTNEDYVIHPIEVAEIVSTVTDDVDVICAAFLHDVIEDCGVTYEQIVELFGFRCARFVLELTMFSEKEDGNRATRKELDRRYLARATPQAKTIKLADLISNTKTIIELDPEFAKTYMKEKKLLLEVLTDGDKSLYEKAKKIVSDYYAN